MIVVPSSHGLSHASGSPETQNLGRPRDSSSMSEWKAARAQRVRSELPSPVPARPAPLRSCRGWPRSRSVRALQGGASARFTRFGQPWIEVDIDYLTADLRPHLRHLGWKRTPPGRPSDHRGRPTTQVWQPVPDVPPVVRQRAALTWEDRAKSARTSRSGPSAPRRHERCSQTARFFFGEQMLTQMS